MFSTVYTIDVIDMNHTESEGNVNNDKNKEKYHHIQNHVRHANNNRTSLPPHQTTCNLELRAGSSKSELAKISELRNK